MDRRYIIAGLFFTVAVIVTVVLAYPKFQVMQISSRLVAEKQDEFEAQMVLVQEISRLRSQHKQMEGQFSVMSELVPPFTKKSVSDLFVELETIAAESGLLIDSISFTEVKDSTQKGKEKAVSSSIFKTVSAQLKMKGEYRDFKNFVRAIEMNRHLMDITLASIASGAEEQEQKDGESESGAAEKTPPMYSVTIHAYYQ